MPYAATDTTTRLTVSGRRQWIIEVSETEAAAASEFSISNLPKLCTLRAYKATLTAGSGTTINPKLGNGSGFTVSTQEHLATNSTTAAHINDNTAVRLHLPDGVLYVRNSVDADTDNSISTVIVITEGHQA